MKTYVSIRIHSPMWTPTGRSQGTGRLGQLNHQTVTIVDTTKMTPEEKAEYLKNFNKS